jgi:hypothetical protein
MSKVSRRRLRPPSWGGWSSKIVVPDAADDAVDLVDGGLDPVGDLRQVASAHRGTLERQAGGEEALDDVVVEVAGNAGRVPRRGRARPPWRGAWRFSTATPAAAASATTSDSSSSVKLPPPCFSVR